MIYEGQGSYKNRTGKEQNNFLWMQYVHTTSPEEHISTMWTTSFKVCLHNSEAPTWFTYKWPTKKQEGSQRNPQGSISVQAKWNTELE